MLGWTIESLFTEESKRILIILSVCFFMAFILYDNMGFVTSDGYRTITLWQFIDRLFN